MSNHEAAPGKNINLTIDGIALTVPLGTKILEAARIAGVRIPTLCDHPDLRKQALCRICVVECDGRGKLFAACANDVWEGVSVVTNNQRLRTIRKTIVELLLANHPRDCLGCPRGGKCELQTLAGLYHNESSGTGKQLFPADANPAGHRIPITRTPAENTALGEKSPLIRDMGKCIKCGRCVTVCQEVQAVGAINTSYRSIAYEITTPYEQALEDGPCVYCGQCAVVCPTGAIIANEQTEQAWIAHNNSSQYAESAHTRLAPYVTQITDSVVKAMDFEFGLAPGTVTKGKMVSALKQLGFDKVFDADVTVSQCIREESSELLGRMESNSLLPMIVSCSASLGLFIKTFYPDLHDRLSVCRSPEQNFGIKVKAWYHKDSMVPSPVQYISIMPCIAKKIEAWECADCKRNADMALTVRELSTMFHQACIDFSNMPENPFDNMNENIDSLNVTGAGNNAETVLAAVYEACIKETPSGISEIELHAGGKTIKALTVNGLANARIILDSIRRGECTAALVHIMCCPLGHSSLQRS